MLQVYLDPCTVNSRKVLAGLELVGMPYELSHVDYFTGAHKKPEFLAINPNGAVPAVVDGDFALSESNAILQYTADLVDSDKHYPKDLKQRADINRWLLWEASTWFPSCYAYLVEYVVKPLLNTEPNEAVIEKEAPNWHRLAGILDARLEKSKWLAGDTVTIADIAVAAPMHVHKAQRLPLEDHPHLKRWMADVEELPCWQKTQGAVDRGFAAQLIGRILGPHSAPEPDTRIKRDAAVGELFLSKCELVHTPRPIGKRCCRE